MTSLLSSLSRPVRRPPTSLPMARRSARLTVVAFAALVWALAAACADDGHDHDPVREANDGLTTVERGLTETDQALQDYMAGDTHDAVVAMDEGIAAQREGSTMLRHGLSSMGTMMERCGADSMHAMEPVDTAVDAMSDAMADLADPTSPDASHAVATMQDEVSMMRDELTRLHGYMTCMGHDSMTDEHTPAEGMGGRGSGR